MRLKKPVLSNTQHQNVLLLSTHAGRKPLTFQLFTNAFNEKSLCYFPYEVMHSNMCSIYFAALSATVMRQEPSERPEFWLPFNIHIYTCGFVSQIFKIIRHDCDSVTWFLKTVQTPFTYCTTETVMPKLYYLPKRLQKFKL